MNNITFFYRIPTFDFIVSIFMLGLGLFVFRKFLLGEKNYLHLAAGIFIGTLGFVLIAQYLLKNFICTKQSLVPLTEK